MRSLQDVRQEPASGKAPEQLVVFLHGIGVDGRDLIGMAPYFASRLPNALFLAPHGGEPFDMAPMGRQWFSLSDLSSEALYDGAAKASEIVNAYLDEQLAATGLSDRQLAVIGFSQGTMTALHAILRRPEPIAALVGYSGALVAAERLYGEIKSRPPTLLVHGAEDDDVPPHNLELAVKALETLRVPVIGELRPGLGHGIDAHALSMGVEFVVDRLTNPPAA